MELYIFVNPYTENKEYEVAETMGDKIRALRIVRGMTQEDLAEKMFMRKSTISAYENDLIDIKSSVIVELAKALNTLPGYFFPGYEDKSPLLMYQCPLLVERQQLLAQLNYK